MRTTRAELDQFLQELGTVRGSSWALCEGKLGISLQFDSFAQAFAFMGAVALQAQAQDHHPEWRNVYDRVDIHLVTHELGCITTKDLALARTISQLAPHF